MHFNKIHHPLALAFLFLICAASFAPAQQTAVARQGYNVVQLARGKQNHLLIELRINGKPAIFMLDSGAPVTTISTSLARSLRLPPPPGEAGLPGAIPLNGQSQKVVWAESLQSGAMNFGSGPLAVGYQESSEINSKYAKGTVEGILGADVLRRYKALLNCGTAQIFFKRDGVPSPSIASGLQKAGYRGTPLKQSGGHFYISATLAGNPGLLLVDTGAFVTLLRKSSLKSFGISYENTGLRAETFHGDLSGVLQVAASAHRLTIANIPIQREVGAVAEPMREADPSVVGILGAELLAFHRAIIDFDNKVFYFHPEFGVVRK